jgi:hypothetical protein
MRDVIMKTKDICEWFKALRASSVAAVKNYFNSEEDIEDDDECE